MLSIGTHKSDRITTITNTTWAEYISLDLPSKRVSFRNGVITIVSPGRNHELISDYIRAIIWTYCRKNNFALFPYNQTTLKEEGKEGKEPDVAYCFEIDKDKPDLAVEINLTSGSIDDLTKYQYLKIAEVWLWEDYKIKFFVFFIILGIIIDNITHKFVIGDNYDPFIARNSSRSSQFNFNYLAYFTLSFYNISNLN